MYSGVHQQYSITSFELELINIIIYIYLIEMFGTSIRMSMCLVTVKVKIKATRTNYNTTRAHNTQQIFYTFKYTHTATTVLQYVYT